MTSSLTIELADHSFELLASLGVHWPQQSALLVADTHFGKEATFRAHGIPVPKGSTDSTLQRISSMLRTTKATRMYILGDMFHARTSLSDDVCCSLESFFADHAHIEMTLVRGNHDAGVGQLPSKWPIKIVDPPHRIGSVALGHHPEAVPGGAKLYFCGHIHPAVRLGKYRGSLGKVPCFWHSKGCVVLPAIGDFTGTHAVRIATGDDAWMVAGDDILSY